MKKLILRACLALCIGASVAPALAIPYLTTTSDPNASQATKNVYDYLRTRRGQSTNSMIEGQFLGMINQILYPGQSFYGYFDINQHVIDGKLPAIAGSRYDGEDKETNVYRLDTDICTRVNLKLIEVWNDAQPIIHLTATPRNPWNQQSGRSPFNSDTQKISALLSTAPASSAKTNFWADMAVIAAGLQELEDEGIPVLFRPFAEFNQTNKYYFDKQSAAHFVSLWQEAYHYYVDPPPAGKGLNNLLFCWEVWALNRNTASANIGPWYPGSNYVDVVAGAFYFLPEKDYHDPQGNFSFAESDPEDQIVYDYLISRDRPFGAAQYGLNQGTNTPGDHEFTRDFMDYSQDLAFAAYWNQYQAVERQANASAFVADPRVATHDDLPLFTGTPASVTLSNLNQTYNGSPRPVTVTTVPAGLSCLVTYNGSSTPPTNAGSYAVVATVTDPNYTGSASGTLVVAKAAATVTLGSLSQTYNGSPRLATATTSPAGLSVSFTYDGSGTAPINAGSYAVVGTINDTNYTGTGSGTLVVAKATATVTLGSLTHTYDGTPKSATATTSPAGLSVSFTYNGSSTPPSAVGSYAVVGTVNDTNYTGTGSGTMTISAGSTVVTFISVAAHDGFVIESGETTNIGGTATSGNTGTAALRAGDNNGSRQLKAFVSFDTTSIPEGVTITAVTLRLKCGAIVGVNPFGTHGACQVDIVGGSGFGGGLALAATDFQAGAGAANVAALSNPVSAGNWSTGAVNASGISVLNTTGHTQFRVAFALDDNDGSVNDYIGWYSGEAAAGNRPELVVTYQ